MVLILTNTHEMLLEEFGNAELRIPNPQIATLEKLREHFGKIQIALPAPVGVQPPNFVFVLQENPEVPPGYQWVSLMKAPTLLKDHTYWKTYVNLMLGGYEPPSKEIDVFSFGNTPLMAAQLAHLVAKGRKRSSSGNIEALQKLNLTVPWKGLVSIVTDGFGIPICCIETERTEQRKFRDVPEEVARGEGEGDLTLHDWIQGHRKFFSEEAQRLGIVFNENTKIITEWFRVLKVFGKEDQYGSN